MLLIQHIRWTVFQEMSLLKWYMKSPVKGELQIVKKGEILEDFDKDFSYQEINLSGAVFDLYAAEDIYTADAQKDEQGNRILEYAEGTKLLPLQQIKKEKQVCQIYHLERMSW